MGIGIFTLVMGILTAGGMTWWAIWAAGKLGPGIWTSAKSLPLMIFFWAGGTAMIIAGIYLIATDHPKPQHAGKHGLLRVVEERRHV